MKANRLTGHVLQAEGAPFQVVVRTETGKPIVERVGSWITTSGTGRGYCSCGATSDVVDTTTKRRQWHRDHKTQIREESQR